MKDYVQEHVEQLISRYEQLVQNQYQKNDKLPEFDTMRLYYDAKTICYEDFLQELRFILRVKQLHEETENMSIEKLIEKGEKLSQERDEK
ncbi:hypothetical protein [Aneurinibacillus migulanus]|uniref:Uncharacterized protein n=1 Tax=Aneurinibacillus migulanus TaxID=47500 RepID=A0A0D1XKK3_ANEMI|nr:hypothetical protein [Aneurinibacillus migulanus]KIV52773.1 hypothetical protein TS65_21780 [Aneurinibacillus migulanus]KON95040.1 hypothetical protein AF333_05635 [Aneurinibacillus migulanus]MED0896521.1 hypothetical protein [Aneurinibacillus migulanus]MED1614936.1 hypothetical protein [Aneurinibacillus migulanus]MED4731724.1 hypothetical protein [Aneurinibacillus migulanus]